MVHKEVVPLVSMGGRLPDLFFRKHRELGLKLIGERSCLALLMVRISRFCMSMKLARPVRKLQVFEVVLLDEKATLKGMEYCFGELYYSPICAEAQALVEGHKLATRAQASRVTFFLDSHRLINMLNGLSNPFLELSL